MTANNQLREVEIGRRIARHAASHCAELNDFAAAQTIAAAWGYQSWRLFTAGCMPAARRTEHAGG
jgi:hypothetical protein